MVVCDFCKREQEEVFEPVVDIKYAKDKEASEVRFCKDCNDFLSDDLPSSLGEGDIVITKDMLEGMREIVGVQGYDGNWDYDEYMWGLYNGMEFMLAMVEGRDPIFRQRPKQFVGNLPAGPHRPAVPMRN